MSFKGFSVFGSGGHFVQCSRMILTFVGRGLPKERFFEIILKFTFSHSLQIQILVNFSE